MNDPRIISPTEAIDIGPELLVPTTYTSTVRERQIAELTALSMAAIDATCLLALSVEDRGHKPPDILIAGETTFSGHSSTSELMRDRALDTFGIEKHRIHILGQTPGNNLIHTAKQMKRLSDAVSGDMAEKALVIPLRFHAVRVLDHARQFRLGRLRATTAQDILAAEGVLGDYPELDYLDDFWKRERFIQLLTKFEPNGYILDILAALQGPRLHDVKQTDDGSGYEAIISTARKHSTNSLITN